MEELEIIEMLKQDDCSRCESAKAMLTKLGYQVVEISLGTLIDRPDRVELMATVCAYDGKVPLMRHQGKGNRWTTSVEELFELSHKSDEQNKNNEQSPAPDNRDKGVSR